MFITDSAMGVPSVLVEKPREGTAVDRRLSNFGDKNWGKKTPPEGVMRRGWFGFEESFFENSLGPASARMVHHAITDIDAQEFHYGSAWRFGGYAKDEGGFSLAIGDEHTADGSDGTDILHAETDECTLDLVLIDHKRPVLQS